MFTSIEKVRTFSESQSVAEYPTEFTRSIGVHGGAGEARED